MSKSEFRQSRGIKLIGVIVASVFMFQEAAAILYAEEASTTENALVQTVEALTQAVSKDGETASEASGAADPESRRARRKERIEKWLENHPNIRERMDRNQDGMVDKQELRQAAHLRRRLQHHRNQQRRDYDNNPPGLLGGPGTNWENQPGPQGGPGASPDRRRYFHRDRDNNPPGLLGGRGTNWENRPGPAGGPGVSPDRQFRQFRPDRDNNPPGRIGGRGTNWENRPGPRGGPGASPNRRAGGFGGGRRGR